jgi:hypothetical protein
MQRNDVSRFKNSFHGFILHSQILHFLIFVYIKAKTLQPKPKTILANALPMFPVPMTPTVLPCKSNPEVPLMKSFVLALDYMLYAFYDLKSISWPWRAQRQPRENRSEHDTLIPAFGQLQHQHY